MIVHYLKVNTSQYKIVNKLLCINDSFSSIKSKISMSAFIAPLGMNTRQEAHLQSRAKLIKSSKRIPTRTVLSTMARLAKIDVPRGVVAVVEVDVLDGDGESEQDGHYDQYNQHDDNILPEPRRPLHGPGYTHQLQRLLSNATRRLVTGSNAAVIFNYKTAVNT